MYFYPLLSLVYAEADNAYNIQVLSFTNNVFDCVFCYIIESYVKHVLFVYHFSCSYKPYENNPMSGNGGWVCNCVSMLYLLY